MALWYKGTGPWWDSTNVKPFDGISLEEEMGSPASLWGWYRDLLVIRKANPALYKGAYVKAANSNPQVFSWMRYTTSPVPQRMLLVVNLSAENQAARLDSPLAGARRIFGSAVLQGDTVLLQPYAMGIFFVH
jgi:glycosidase